MNETQNNLPQLLMRASLHQLPELSLPSGITIRSFLDGDEGSWNQVISTSFNSPYDFNEHMKKDPQYKAERVLFALVDGVPAATASAWYQEEYGPDTGCIHMVGALPQYSGKRLGYLVSLAAMHKLKSDGFTQVVLQTDDFRIPAIKTYLKLGFEIDLSIHESMPDRWRQIRKVI